MKKRTDIHKYIFFFKKPIFQISNIPILNQGDAYDKPNNIVYCFHYTTNHGPLEKFDHW